ncbi:MAG: hypothetical protein ACTSP4_05605 [Candidatus Hodarchaeales archaeon]
MSQAYKTALEKFVKATGAFGVYIYDSGRLIVLHQVNPTALLALRQTITSLDQENEITHELDGVKYGIIVNELVRDENGVKSLVMVCEALQLAKIKVHWKRLSPVLKKKIPLDSIIVEDSLQTKIVRITSQILVNYEECLEYLRKVKSNV